MPRRGGDAGIPGDRGFLSQTQDPTTGFVYLNNRYYDTSLGRFASTDPLAGLSNPQALNPFTYALNNPSTLTDPTGLGTGEKCGWVLGSDVTCDTQSSSNAAYNRFRHDLAMAAYVGGGDFESNTNFLTASELNNISSRTQLYTAGNPSPTAQDCCLRGHRYRSADSYCSDRCSSVRDRRDPTGRCRRSRRTRSHPISSRCCRQLYGGDFRRGGNCHRGCAPVHR